MVNDFLSTGVAVRRKYIRDIESMQVARANAGGPTHGPGRDQGLLDDGARARGGMCAPRPTIRLEDCRYEIKGGRITRRSP